MYSILHLCDGFIRNFRFSPPINLTDTIYLEHGTLLRACCHMPNDQLFSYIMARTNYFLQDGDGDIICTRPTSLVQFLLC